jgi:hypothetical protein
MVVVLLTLAGNGAAYAANTTSAGATIHNYVSVNYTSGTTSVTTYAAVDVKVLPVFAPPTVTKPAPDQLVVAGAAVTYSSTITTNSNGQDTLDLSQTIAPTGMNGGNPATTFNFGGSPVTKISLWGGLAVSVASQNVINLPGASLTGTAFLTEIGSAMKPTVVINTKLYTVTSATTGNIAATTAGGAQTAETYDTITVSPVDGTSNISSLGVGATIQEQKTVTYNFTAGTPSAAGMDGYYDSTLTATSEGLSSQLTTTASFRTTVQSPNLTITKQCAVNPGWGLGTIGGSYTATCNAKPGDTIEYLITLTNANANVNTVASSVKVQDPVIYVYTTYVTQSTYGANGTTTLGHLNDSGSASPLVAGYTFPASIAGGSTSAITTNQAFIVYRVTVN